MGGMLRTKLVRLMAVTALVATQACGDGGAAPAPLDVPDEGDEEMDAGRGSTLDAGKRDAGGSGGDAGPLLGPLVEVLSPGETDDPASEDVVSSSTLTVRCSVKRNPKGEIVDTKSVKVSIYSGDDAKPAVSQVATSTAETDVFQAENISMAMVPHGVIRVECAASDAAAKVQSSVGSIFTLYDEGPNVTFLYPSDKYVAVNNVVVVKFRVEPRALSDDDPGAQIGEIKATVGGRPVEAITESSSEDHTYTFSVDFKDPQLFIAIPKTLSVRVDATNKREPKASTTSANLAVGVDAEGPTITVKSPVRVNGQDPVVSGKVDVVMEIKDALAGVNDSVEIRVGKETYPAEAQGNGLYTATFETGSFPGLPSLNVTLVARDNVSIETTSNLSLDIDTVPPWLSLDAPTVREVNEKTPVNDCTGPFDPLGEAVAEGTIPGSAFVPRVIIWDRPLKLPTDSIVTRYAMIDDTTTRLYIQHNSEVPLLVDRDGDSNHECDAINNNSEDTSKAPTPLVLSPVKPVGVGPLAGSFVTTGMVTSFVPNISSDPNASALCGVSISGQTMQPTVASDTVMTRVIKHTAVDREWPVVYADSPTTSGLRLTGKAYVSMRTGWACLVAVAKDNAGNFGFTPPMRVCIDGGKGVCASAPPPPSCTDGCTIPAKFLPDAPDAMPRLLFYRK
jgi:hypothetical protein